MRDGETGHYSVGALAEALTRSRTPSWIRQYVGVEVDGRPIGLDAPVEWAGTADVSMAGRGRRRRPERASYRGVRADEGVAIEPLLAVLVKAWDESGYGVGSRPEVLRSHLLDLKDLIVRTVHRRRSREHHQRVAQEPEGPARA